MDPRITKNHIVKSVEYLRAHPEEARERAIPNQLTYQPLATLVTKLEGKNAFLSPRHLRVLVDDDLVTAIRSYRRDPYHINNWFRFWGEAVDKAKEAQPLGYREDAINTEDQITEAAEVLKTLLSAKLVVGFHPDQATDPCIDLAAELGVPFCIVPCCVFPAEFQHRRLADGSRVRCYNQLIEYLNSKSPSIQTAMLNFHFAETAKNIVLYTLPSSSDTTSSQYLESESGVHPC
jgi:hypothetical protein